MARINPTTIEVKFSEGTGKSFGKAKNRALFWPIFKKRFEVFRTPETQRQYNKLSHEEQVELKALKGWFYRTQIDGGRRNAKSGRASNIVTLDIDYGTEEFLDRLEAGLVAPGLSYLAISTRRHERDKPRIRIIVLLDGPVTNDMYPVVSRIVAQRYFDPEMKMVDKVSFRAAQMMFWPTASKDQEFIYYDNDDKRSQPVMVNEVLDEFEASGKDWRNVADLPHVDGETVRLSADKAENPLEKRGPVGNFCRAYPNIEDAMAKWLPGVYEPSDDNSEKPRYTFVGATTFNGAVIEDDGLFLYSHHGTDPVADMLVNAFDLVRIHLFGDLDEEKHLTEPMHKRPSWEAMMEHIENDQKYREQQTAEKYDLEAMFDDLGDFDGDESDPDDAEDDEDLVGDPGSRREAESHTDEDRDTRADAMPDLDEEDLVGDPRKANPPPKPGKMKSRWKPAEKGWHMGLEINKAGEYVGSVANLATIVQSDPRCGPTVEWNEFFTKLVTRFPLRSKMKIIPTMPILDRDNGDPWEDRHSMCLRIMLEAENGPGKPGWGLKVTDRDLQAALETAARQYPFHPVKDRIESVEWDGVKRMDTIFIDYLGCVDHVYHREAARKFFTAAVARIYEPGHKFDFVPILQGGQGIRKSTFIRTLSLEWFGELKGDFADEKRMVEQMMGCFIMELPELSAVTRSSVEEIKAFTSAKESTVRLSYARLPQTFKRQCVFMGSTNEHEYLIDQTGNRRWWPLVVRVKTIDIDKLAKIVPQLWAEALVSYREMRAAQPRGDLRLFLEDPLSVAMSNALQEEARTQTDIDFMASTIQDWLDRPIEPEVFDEPTAVREFRDVTCCAQVWKEALGGNRSPNPTESKSLGKALRQIGWTVGVARRFPGYGVSKAYHRPPEDDPASRYAEMAGEADDDIENLV